MLRELRIRDFAIIDELTIHFRSGLNVITGETGAGKSIILQALALLSGTRATSDVIRSDAEQASIEGLFEVSVPPGILEAVGSFADDDLVVRRQVSRSGKGRIFINGNLATLGLLKRLGEHLVHIYGQYDQALLLQPASHLELLDRFGDLGELRRRMEGAHAALAAARGRVQDLARHRAGFEQKKGLLEFQRQELLAADLRHDEETELRREREEMRHAERLAQVCRDGESMLYSGESASVAQLGRLGSNLSELVRVLPALAAVLELVDAARVQLEEAALQLRHHAQRVRFDAERLDRIEERLALLSQLSRKYAVPSSELPLVLEQIHVELESLDARASDLSDEQARLEERRAEAVGIAGDLSTARHGAARRLEESMSGELAALGMNDAVFRVDQKIPADESAAEILTATGFDAVEFHLSANPGEEPKPLARIASGGELSRIMLALKALTATSSETPILIFDEVDAGIGGTVADAVARRLKSLAASRQLFCITHVPQIAAYADHHFAVEKHRRRGRTFAEARILGADERVQELSRMLGGTVAPTEAERYARRLIAQGYAVG
jgi:DNA repair protein RecN (Recombination protein N)